MMICHCRAVSARRIRAVVRAGAETPAQVARGCSAGSECGGCIGAVQQIISQERGRAPARNEPQGSISIAAAAR